MPQQAVRFPDDLHSAIKAEAERRGKPHTFSSVLIEWATKGSALEAVLSEAEGRSQAMQSGPAPVPSAGLSSDGVRPAAQPRTHGEDKRRFKTPGHPITCDCPRCVGYV